MAIRVRQDDGRSTMSASLDGRFVRNAWYVAANRW